MIETRVAETETFYFALICGFCGPVIEVHLKPLVPCVGFNSRGKVCHNRVRKGLSIGNPMIELIFRFEKSQQLKTFE